MLWRSSVCFGRVGVQGEVVVLESQERADLRIQPTRRDLARSAMRVKRMLPGVLDWLAAGPLGASSTSSARRRAHEGRPAWTGRPGRGFAIECLAFLLELHYLLALQACPAGAFCGAAAQSGLDAERGDAAREKRVGEENWLSRKTVAVSAFDLT